MTKEQMRKIAIAINDAKLDGRITPEVYAAQIYSINEKLINAGLTWDDLQN